jgi:subtilisin family serine protease
LALCLASAAVSAPAGTIDLGLQEVLDFAAPQEVVSTIVHLSAQTNLQALEQTMRAASASPALRHELVVRSLQQTADGTQFRLFDHLEGLYQAGRITRYDAFWIVNAFRVDATPAEIKELANHPDVGTIYYNYPIFSIAPIETPQTVPPKGDYTERRPGPETPEPGLVAINVPQVWAMGINGAGILVSTLDTGVAGNHPALASRWRGLDPNYSGHPGWAFFDPVTNWQFPQDSGSHGTHTMGTVCGGAPGDEVGVAPGAQWIHAAVIDRVSLQQTCTDSILAFQWLIDPDGNPGTNHDVPHTNSNSWGIGTWHNVPPFNNPCDPSFWSYIDACETAGIAVFFSAGNEGPTPNSHRRPADRATDDYRSCSVGAVNGNQGTTFPMASFSSRGPTNCTPNYPPGDPFIKPNISAPGENVRSSVPGGYSSFSGTSMASPHINGVAALIRQACPDLTVDEVKQCMYDTVFDRGAPGKDNDYGWGVVDALAAVNRAISLCVTSEGRVTLDRDVYLCEDTAIVTVRDLDLNVDPYVNDVAYVTIVSGTEPGGEAMTLTEDDPNSGRFVGSIGLSATNAPGVLQVADLDPITVTYIDADNGQGGYNIPVTDTATVDCQAPVISNVQATNIMAHSATITFTTNESARGTVHYGLSCGNLNQSATASSFSTNPTINLTGLQDNQTYFYVVEAEDLAGNVGSDPNCYSFSTPEVPEYFTQMFDTEQNDLDNLMFTFEPNGSPDFYFGCVEPITSLPTDPTGGTPLTLTDDSFVQVNLSGGAQVWLYGTSYTSAYVGSNGYITFGSGDTDYTESFADHFAKPRVACLFDDLNPATGGQVSYKQLADRLAVTWLNVPEYGASNQNTFQIELFFSGRMTASFLAIAAVDGLAGLSRGTGVPGDFYESDLTAIGSCGPRPPNASGQNLIIPVDAVTNITLIATDDGLPDPPAALTYRIMSLPVNGDLSDPGAGPITSAPYDLVGGGNVVVYTPDPGYYGNDAFTFLADDGGVPPEGGPSNLATIAISVQYGPPDITTLTLPNGCVGGNYSVQLEASQGQPPLVWSLVPGDVYTESDLGSSQFAAVGTARNWRADDSSWVYALPFTFPYYGVNYNSVNVCSNGFIDFTSNSSSYSNSDSGLKAAVRIGVMWDDLMTNQNTGDDIYIDETVPGQVTIRWKGTTYASPRPAINTAITLFTDGRIRFHYGPSNSSLTPTIGISMGDNAHFTLSTYNNATSLPNANSHEFEAVTPLPANVTLDSNGLLSGVPVEAGSFQPRIKVTDSLNRSDEQTYTLIVDPDCPFMTGDMDCDGDVDFDDINPFVLAIQDPQGYQAAYPNCNWLNGDTDGDGDVDFDDINGFVALLSGD